METPAPYHTDAPKGPRNLTPHVATWLRRLGFTATEQHLPQLATVAAHWVGPSGERFELSYLWQAGPVPDATCQMGVRYPGQVQPEPLFTAQHVRRVKDVRQLVGNCVRLHNARLLARLPAPAPP